MNHSYKTISTNTPFTQNNSQKSLPDYHHPNSSNQKVNQSTNQIINTSIKSSNHQKINQSNHQPISTSNHQHIKPSTHQPISTSNNQPITTLLLFIFLLISSIGNTQTLDDYLIIAAENNPNLKAKYLQYQAALERAPQAGSLPDPQLSFSVMVMPMERYMGNQLGSISLMQMFPWFGTLDAAKKEMSYMAKARFEEFNEAKSELFYEVRGNWYALQLLEQEISITKENIELLQTIKEIAINRFKIGTSKNQHIKPSTNQIINTSNHQHIKPSTHQIISTSKNQQIKPSTHQPISTSKNQQIKPSTNQPISTSNHQQIKSSTHQTINTSINQSKSGDMIDVLRVQMEINELKNNLLLLEDSKTTIQIRFNKLLNRNRNKPIAVPDTITSAELPISLMNIPDSIKNNNPMLRMLRQEEEALIAQGEKNERMGMPMIGVGLQYDIYKSRDNVESRMNGRNMLMPMATVSIPLWREKYDASVRESDFKRQSTIQQRQNVSNQLMVNYEDALRDYKDADRRLALYQQQTSLANQALNILVAQYMTDGANFGEVIRMQKQLLDYRLKFLDAIIDGNIAVTMMERLMGR